MKYWLFIFLVCLLACDTTVSTEVLTNNCSSVQLTEDRLLVTNAFYQVLEDEQVLSITEEYVVGDSLGINKLFVTDFESTTGDAGHSWEIALENVDYSIEKNVLLAQWNKSGLYDASYSAYSLLSGEKLLDYTYDKLEIVFNQVNERRYFGFYSDNGIPIEAYSDRRTKETFGLLTYANQDEQLQQLRLTAADPMWLDLLDISNPVFELVPLTEGTISLNSGKSLFFTGQSTAETGGVNFDINIVFYTTDSYKPVVITLPVRNDQLQIPTDFEHSVFALESL